MALRITAESLDKIRDELRFPIMIIKDKLNRENPELLEELVLQFDSIDKLLQEITNKWDVWNE